MRISDLVKKLEALKAAKGDLPVRVTDGDGYYEFCTAAVEIDGMELVQIDTTGTNEE